MSVTGPLWFALEVPSIDEGIRFYTDAGLVATTEGASARLHCAGLDHPSIVLIGGSGRKRLHHIALRATDLDGIARRVPAAGGEVIPPPAGMTSALDRGGLWVKDPHGLHFHLLDVPPDPKPKAGPAFEINAPGHIVRTRRSAMHPVAKTAAARPLKLGHVVTFTPDVMKSVAFVTDALGLGLADHALDLIAFCCARQDSDHHVLAFAKSSGVGLHHCSFEVRDPDEVGRAGRALVEKSRRGEWGLGRHTIGSNFFHYIEDPWGSWFEYYADMDYIDDYSLWKPTNYGMEDSLANWGPALPPHFIRNAEVE